MGLSGSNDQTVARVREGFHQSSDQITAALDLLLLVKSKNDGLLNQKEVFFYSCGSILWETTVLTGEFIEHGEQRHHIGEI